MARVYKLEKGDIISISVGKDIGIIEDYKKIKLGDYLVAKKDNHTFKSVSCNIDEYDVVLQVISTIKKSLFQRFINWMLRKNNYTTFRLKVMKN